MINDKLVNIYTDEKLLAHPILQGEKLPDLRRIYDGTADSAYEEEIPDEQRESNGGYIHVAESQGLLGMKKINTHDQLYGLGNSMHNYDEWK